MAIKEIKREWQPCQLAYVKTFLLHTEEDLKNMPRCSVGSRATVSETDNEYVKTSDGWMLLCDCDEDGGQGAGGGSSVQPDWNQNDPNAADYIRNRPRVVDEYATSRTTAFPTPLVVGARAIKASGSTATVANYLIRYSDVMPYSDDVLVNGTYYDGRSLTIKANHIITFDGGFAIAGTTKVYAAVIYKAGLTFDMYALSDKMILDGAFPETGLYLQAVGNTAARPATEVAWGGVVSIDEAVIPDTIARKSDLSAGGSGSVEIVAVSCETADMQTFTNATKNKSYAELKAAYDAGKLVWCRFTLTVGTNVAVAEAPLAFVAYDADMVGMNFSPFGIIGDQGVVITIDSNDGCTVAID